MAEEVEEEIKGNRALSEKLGKGLLKRASRTPLERNPPPPHDPELPTLKAANLRAVDRTGMIPTKVTGPTPAKYTTEEKTEKDRKLEEFAEMTAKYPHMSAELLLAFPREQTNPQQPEPSTSANGSSPRYQRRRSTLYDAERHNQNQGRKESRGRSAGSGRSRSRGGGRGPDRGGRGWSGGYGEWNGGGRRWLGCW